jgi:hypothetical protein
MPKPDFYLDVSDRLVNVRLNASPRGRFYACIFFGALTALAMCGLVFLPGKHGNPSMWHDLSSHPVDSGGFIVPLVLLWSFPLFMGLLTWRYVVAAYPSDEPFVVTDQR